MLLTLCQCYKSFVSVVSVRMDEDEKSKRCKKLGFIPQKEKYYNKLLPYADKLDEESIKLFSDIKTNLVKSVIAREMRPGCALWTSRLNK